MSVLRSVCATNAEALAAIQKLHVPSGFEADVTFGNGGFWRDGVEPQLKFDLQPLRSDVVAADSRRLPLKAESVGSIVFDPPFLTYVRAGRSGNGAMRMAQRFSGYWTLAELKDHYQESISEAYRVLKRGGVYVFKCQDIIHNHRLFCTHAAVISWAESEGFRLRDLITLVAAHRMPAPNRRGTQRHTRIFHSYFLVFERGPFISPASRRSEAA